MVGISYVLAPWDNNCPLSFQIVKGLSASCSTIIKNLGGSVIAVSRQGHPREVGLFDDIGKLQAVFRKTLRK